jgi:hypothetical protein
VGHHGLGAITDVDIVDPNGQSQHGIDVHHCAADRDVIGVAEVLPDDGGDTLPNDAEFGRAGENDQRSAQDSDDQDQQNDQQRPQREASPRRALAQRAARLL